MACLGGHLHQCHGHFHIAFHADAVFIHQAQHKLRLDMLLQGGFHDILGGFFNILFKARAVVIHGAEHVLRFAIALIGGFFDPIFADRKIFLPCHRAVEIKRSQRQLRLRIAVMRRFQQCLHIGRRRIVHSACFSIGHGSHIKNQFP